MIRTLVRALCLVFGAAALPGWAWQTDAPLQLERIRLGTDAEVSFETQPGMEDPDAAAEIREEPQPVSRNTADQKYTLHFLPSRVRAQNAGSYFSYDFFVSTRGQPQRFTRYRVNSTVTGSFLDGRKETAFRIAGSDGKIELPIFCPGRPSLVEVTQARADSRPVKVAISGEPVQVTLRNLSGLAVLVRLSQAGGAELSATAPDPKRQFAINAWGTKTLNVPVKPSVVRALTATYAPATAATPHGRLNLTLECEFADSKGIELEPLTAAVPLEFAPSFWHLGGAVAVGAGVGWMFCLLVSLITGYRRTNGIAKLAAKLAVAVLLGWILDVASALTDSRLVLFGFDVNPTRLPPAFVLGLIAGVIGSWYLDRVVDFAETKVKPPDQAAMGAAAS